MPKHRAPLTEKERAFVNAYMGVARGNGTQAAKLAGYSGAAHVLKVTASRLLTKANVGQAIVSRQNVRTMKALLAAEDCDRILSEIAQAPDAEVYARIRAISELNKVRGRHTIKHINIGQKTLEMLLGESRGMKLVGGGKA